MEQEENKNQYQILLNTIFDSESPPMQLIIQFLPIKSILNLIISSKSIIISNKTWHRLFQRDNLIHFINQFIPIINTDKTSNKYKFQLENPEEAKYNYETKDEVFQYLKRNY